jgi:hypothetical protein
MDVADAGTGSLGSVLEEAGIGVAGIGAAETVVVGSQETHHSQVPAAVVAKLVAAGTGDAAVQVLCSQEVEGSE